MHFHADSDIRGGVTGSFKPFSVAFKANLADIENREKTLKELAGMATMEGVKGINTH
jgi:hypothetical protein